MKRLFKQLEKIYAAAAFAEEDEHKTAREILREEERKETRVTPSKRIRKQMRAERPE